jgi:1-deoxy-D-xylulose-5-phosphate synthase
VRYKISQRLTKWGLLSEKRKKGILRFHNSLKSLLSRQQNIFEGLDLRYFGPVDGHDVKELVRILNTIKDMSGPKLLHIHTVKGKGYEPAEKDARIWHAPGKFNEETGERQDAEPKSPCPPKFQDVFGETLLELAEKNEKIVGVTPAMPTGCSMNIMMAKMPERGFDVGIAEGHAVTFSGGLAKDGMMPFCNIYSSFMQRAYDNIIHDAAIMNLNLVLCLDRAGLVGEDGATHHGAFDLAFLRPIPNITIASPYNEWELRKMMYTAQLPGKGTFVIRYPRGRGSEVDWRCDFEELEVGRGRKLTPGNDIAVLTLGPIGKEAEKAIAKAEINDTVATVNEANVDSMVIEHHDARQYRRMPQDYMAEIDMDRIINDIKARGDKIREEVEIACSPNLY